MYTCVNVCTQLQLYVVIFECTCGSPHVYVSSNRDTRTAHDASVNARQLQRILVTNPLDTNRPSLSYSIRNDRSVDDFDHFGIVAATFDFSARCSLSLSPAHARKSSLIAFRSHKSPMSVGRDTQIAPSRKWRRGVITSV